MLSTDFLMTIRILFIYLRNRQSPRNIEILVGTNDLTKGGKYLKVVKLQAHEKYNHPQFAYDIAVITLQDKLEFNEKTQPIELGEEDVPHGEQVQLTGWGRLRVRCICRFHTIDSLDLKLISILGWRCCTNMVANHQIGLCFERKMQANLWWPKCS